MHRRGIAVAIVFGTGLLAMLVLVVMRSGDGGTSAGAVASAGVNSLAAPARQPAQQRKATTDTPVRRIAPRLPHTEIPDAKLSTGLRRSINIDPTLLVGDIKIAGEDERMRNQARAVFEQDVIAVYERIGIDATREISYSLQTAEFPSCVSADDPVDGLYAQVFFDMEVVNVDNDASVIVHDVVGPPGVLSDEELSCLFYTRDGYQFPVNQDSPWESGRFRWSIDVPLQRRHLRGVQALHQAHQDPR